MPGAKSTYARGNRIREIVMNDCKPNRILRCICRLGTSGCMVQHQVTVLPYMGKPVDKERKHYKPRTVFTDGVKRVKAIILESEE